MITEILSDERTIKRITSGTYPETFDWITCSLEGGISKIAPYAEYGGATWFAIYIGAEICYRVSAADMVVEYAKAVPA